MNYPIFSPSGTAALAAAILIAVGSTTATHAQLSPFPDPDSTASGGRDLPEILPPDMIEPVINPRQASADRIARLFNRDLRDIEETQRDISEQLEKLPRTARELQRITGFGYHSGRAAKRPKWLQIDMGEAVTPDAIALFPVTAAVEEETVYGYGFPRGFRIDISNEEDFRNYETMVEGRSDDPRGERRWPYFRELGGYTGRYIRITATSLWRSSSSGREAFALSEVMVLKGGRNLAVGKQVRALDSEEISDQWALRFACDGITTLGIPHGSEESPTLGFRARSEEPVNNSWVQVDLGEAMPIDEIQLILADSPATVPDPTVRFPYPLRIDISESPDMRRSELAGRFNPSQISMIGANPLIVPVDEGYGRYVRVTVTGPKKATVLSFDLAELIVYSGTVNVARGKPVTALHPVKQGKWAPAHLTDGFSSRRNLVTYETWLADLSKRNRLVRRWLEKEEARLDLVDRTVTRGITYTASGLAGVFGLVFMALSRGRVKRRRDLEDLRQRIASDLHDDIGSNLSSIALLAELGKTEAEEPELVAEELTEIKSTADKTIESMRDIVWLIRPGEETWQQMLARFRETASKLLRAHEYNFVVNADVHDDRLPLEFKRDLFLIYKEVLNNIVRHAEAKNVEIEIDYKRHRLQLRIVDDGIGFNNLDQEFREGNGLRNLRMRAQAIGANLKVRSALNEGTTVLLTVPMP
ncbi:MAG: histidine kinase [Verrucomicrobiales bacterium]